MPYGEHVWRCRYAEPQQSETNISRNNNENAKNFIFNINVDCGSNMALYICRMSVDRPVRLLLWARRHGTAEGIGYGMSIAFLPWIPLPTEDTRRMGDRISFRNHIEFKHSCVCVCVCAAEGQGGRLHGHSLLIFNDMSATVASMRNKSIFRRLGLEYVWWECRGRRWNEYDEMEAKGKGGCRKLIWIQQWLVVKKRCGIGLFFFWGRRLYLINFLFMIEEASTCFWYMMEGWSSNRWTRRRFDILYSLWRQKTQRNCAESS